MHEHMQWGAIAVYLALASVSVNACSSSSGSAPVDAAVEAAAETRHSPDVNCDPTLTYTTFGMDFFAAFCGRCHMWTQESAQLDGDAIAGAAGSSTTMPPSAPFPTADQRTQLVQWIACGAP